MIRGDTDPAKAGLVGFLDDLPLTVVVSAQNTYYGLLVRPCSQYVQLVGNLTFFDEDDDNDAHNDDNSKDNENDGNSGN